MQLLTMRHNPTQPELTYTHSSPTMTAQIVVNLTSADDTYTVAAGNYAINGMSGNDTITTGAGDDLVSYHVTGNAGTLSVFTSAAGIDTLNLVMTGAEWMSAAVQTDVANYLIFLADNKGASGEDNAAAFTFTAFGLTASMFEKLRITISDTNEAAVITGASTGTLSQTNVARSTGGTLTATDADSSAAFTVQTGVAGSNGYGSFAINASGV